MLYNQGVVLSCPFCQAQYSLRVLKIEEDGRVKCQNCGRPVDFSEESSQTPEELEPLDE